VSHKLDSEKKESRERAEGGKDLILFGEVQKGSIK